MNNKGGTHSPCLLALTLELWQWCLERNIMISAQHVPGKLNSIAESESRVFNDSSEWKIDPQTISPFLKGCEIDLFASRLSAQLPQYVSWRPDPRRCVDNGLGTPQGLRLSTFQSDPSRLKQSVSGQSGHHISGTHLASTTMVATATKPPDRTSSPPTELQTPPEGPSRPSENSHPMFPRLHLAVFHVSGDSTRQWELQTMLRRFSFRHPANLQGKHINQLGDAGVAGVVRERLILFQRL